MHTRQETTDYRNRATGYTDSDWGALEKRLSDTRDLLRDILVHLRRVLDNLKTAGNAYQGAGRAWRSTANPSAKPAGAYAGQQGRQQTGSAADARKAPGAAGSRFQSDAFKTSSSSASSDKRPPFGAQRPQAGRGASGTAGTSWAGGAARAAGTAGATGTAGAKGTAGAAGTAGAKSAGQQFSWNARGQNARPGQDAWRSAGTAGAAGAAGAGNASGQAGASSQAGSAGAAGQRPGASSSSSGAWRAKAESTRDQGQQSRQEHAGSSQGRQEQRHRTTGPGGGSSYQEYKQRSHKSPLGHGRMTLTQACALLCITYPCNADDIKSAYRKQARRHHPDLGGDEEMMKSINQAYELAISWCSPLRGKSAATWAA